VSISPDQWEVAKARVKIGTAIRMHDRDAIEINISINDEKIVASAYVEGGRICLKLRNTRPDQNLPAFDVRALMAVVHDWLYEQHLPGWLRLKANGYLGAEY